MRLQITGGPDSGSTIEPGGERFTVGREGVDFLLADEEVSRQHFELQTLPDGRVEINDLGSRNGTRVDGERISGPRTLSGGEEIKVGVTTIMVESPPQPTTGGETVVAGGDVTAVSPQPPADPDATVAAEVPPGLAPTEEETAPQPAAPPPPPARAPAPPPPPARAAPPPPGPPVAAPGAPRPDGTAPTGLRVTALVLSIVVILAAIFGLIVAAVALSADLCDEIDPASLTFSDLNDTCYEGSDSNRVIGAILAGLGAIASIAFLVFSITYFSRSRRGPAVLVTGIASIVLIGASIAIL